MKQPLSILAILALAASLPASAQHTESNERVVLEEIVARVNNEIVTLTELERGRQTLRRELREEFSGVELEKQYQQREKDLLRDLIDQMLLVQRGEEIGISVEAEVIRSLDRMRQQLKLNTMEELERYITEQGMAFEDYRQELRNQLLTQAVLQREVARNVMLDEEEVRNYYLQHRHEMARPERVRLRELLVNTQGLSGEALAAREERMREALEKIRKGEPFDQVARAYSDSPTAQDGGELGYFEPDKLSGPVREAVMKLRDGGVTDPLRTPQGLLVLQLVKYEAAGIPEFEEVEGEIRQKLYYDLAQPAFRDYLSQLRRENYVFVQSGYVDTGAVEPEAKPRGLRPGSKRAKKRE